MKPRDEWVCVISIHVLREEDDAIFSRAASYHDISIHVLREEDDFSALFTSFNVELFQSTSSARRTTLTVSNKFLFYHISIHVLREEDDNV